MKPNFSFFLILFTIFSFIITAKKETKTTTITITTKNDVEEKETQKEEEKEEEEQTVPQKQPTPPPEEKQEETGESSQEAEIKKAKNRKNLVPTEKYLIMEIPYQDNEDYVISPLGLGTPASFIPVQVDTTTFKTWVASANQEENSNSAFCYNVKDSSTSDDTGDWDTVVDEEGTVSGNIIYDIAYLDKYKIEEFKFIEAIEYEDEFKDYKFGKLGMGNCHYADDDDKEFCLLQRLKDNGSIMKRVFSIRELNDTHGELVIGDVTEKSKNNDYPLLNVVNEDIYEDIEDDEFKMSWLTKINYVLFKNDLNDISHIFDNRIKIESGYASFDSSCHYIEAPYNYINYFEEQLFEKIIPNVCRKVNQDGTYMFFCNVERFSQVYDRIEDLSFVIVIDGYGFTIKMKDLFERTAENDYEFFIHFKDYEQNIWNLGHPFFHNYTVIFDQDNQEIGVDGKMIYNLMEELEAINKKEGSSNWWKVLLVILLVLLLLGALFYLGRKYGIQSRLDKGISPSLVDNESADDLSFAPGQNVR